MTLVSRQDKDAVAPSGNEFITYAPFSEAGHEPQLLINYAVAFGGGVVQAMMDLIS